jgi:ribose transport system substrate-binding protein
MTNPRPIALNTIACVALCVACPLFTIRPACAADDAVSAAKEAVGRYAGPQTAWQGPNSAPAPAKDKFIVYLSGDEQNDISREYGLYMKEAAAKLGWKFTVIDGKGSPGSWVAGFNQAIALKPNGIAIFADAKSLQGPIRTATDQDITVIGLHAASLPGPAPDLHLFVNIQEDPREIGKAEADWAIADSNGKARVVVVTHNEYQIAATKSGATRDEIQGCQGCKVLDYVNFPASEAAQRMPQLTTSWLQRFGLPLCSMSLPSATMTWTSRYPPCELPESPRIRPSSSAQMEIDPRTNASGRVTSTRRLRFPSRSSCRLTRRADRYHQAVYRHACA